MFSSIYYGCKLEQESKNYIYEMQKERYKVFKSQDSTNEQFDVIFEIEGKKIYASKYVLISVSEYMNAFLSDRWLKKDEVIKIETYSYDSFYQFLCFLYSGHCHLTTQNVYELTDMAESYAVSCLKDFCDKYCFRMDKTIESIGELTEFALKYSLPHLIDSIKSFILNNGDKVYNNETFIAFKKPFIEFLSSINRVRDSRLKGFENSFFGGHRNESGFFECIYNWAEHQVMKQEGSNDCNFNLPEAVKAELSNILPGIKYCNMRFDFLMDFVVEKGFILSPAEFKEIHSGCFAYDLYSEEKRFKCIYELAEKQASQKQKISPNQDFNVVDSIKTDLTEVLSDLKFGKMGKEFLMNFVVANGIITEEQVKHVYDTRVEIQNAKRSIHGLMKGDLGIRLASEAMYFNNYVDQYSTTITRFSRFNFSVPKTPSTLMKMKGCDWYLCLENDGFLAFKHHTRIVNTDYLLAEMKSEAEFYLNENRYTYIYAEYVNLSDINDNDSNMRSQLNSIKSTPAAQITTIQRESNEEEPDWGDAHEDFDEIYKNNEETDLGDVHNKYVATHLLSQVSIGMDLTKVTLPTSLLERRSLLEMYADFFAHPDDFLKGTESQNAEERMVAIVKYYLGVFYPATKSGSIRKPYNPILGETFRCRWTVPGLKLTGKRTTDGPFPGSDINQVTFVAEQVSHHPPISAFYAEHPAKRVSLIAQIWTKATFLGLSIYQVENIGNATIYLQDFDEKYVVNFPSGYGRPIMSTWMELGGKVELKCEKTGYFAEIEFLAKPFLGGKPHKISGSIFKRDIKKLVMTLKGEWNNVIFAKPLRGKEFTFVDAKEKPEVSKECEPVAKQGDRESRKLWRHVTCALFRNQINTATSAKVWIEQRQRDEAQKRQQSGKEFQPKLFEKDGENWVFKYSLEGRKEP